MRFSFISALTVALAADATASSWFSKAVYNKWHETELERWLSDHNVPYPTPADRKDLENLVKANWNDYVVTPYNTWDAQQLQAYLATKGNEAQDAAAQSKDNLIASVKSSWYETEDQANDAYSSVKDWIFDTWTESQLKAFADRNGIPVPQPRARDSLLQVIRSNYQSAANKLDETIAYPGDWLYASWSDSDLKAWLDEHGYPAPQTSTRDQLIASLRRNSRLASLKASAIASSVSASAAAATQTLSDALLNSWSDSQLKEWFDKNGIAVPQGSKRNELIALARKHSAKLTGDNASYKASSAYNAATSSAGNEYAKASREAAARGNQGLNAVGSYIDWFKYQLGLLDEQARSSYTSAVSEASKTASSLSSLASASSSSASVAASKAASKSGQKAGDAVKESASAAKHRASEAAQKAGDYIKEEL